jgi:citrate synthase
VAAETVLSRSDGARGILWVRGRTLDELVTDYGYEVTVALLWEGFLGDGLTRDGIRIALGEARMAAFMRLTEWLDAAAHRPMVEGVRLPAAGDTGDTVGGYRSTDPDEPRPSPASARAQYRLRR